MKKQLLQKLSIVLSILLFSFIFTSNISYAQTNTEGDPPDNPGIKEEQTDTGEKGMVVTAHPEATKVGEEVLRQGGNAMDAAAAIQLALNVVEPQMSGIGGGGFILYYDASEKEVFVQNNREKAPSDANPELFIDPETNEPYGFSERVESGRSVGVPGTLKGLEEALEEWGTKSLDELIDPAIDLAENGHKVNWSLANAIDSNKEKLSKTEAGNVFVPKGEPLKEGDQLVQKDLAKSFKLIKEQGIDVFYGGEIGKALSDEVQARDGLMTIKDLKSYDTEMLDPIKGSYEGYDIYSMPPPSSGGLVVVQLLSMFEKLDITQWDINSAEKYHHLVEAFHLAYADRAEYMGDENYIDVPKNGLLHSDYIDERIDLINPNNANENVIPGNPCQYETEDIDDVCTEAEEQITESKEKEEKAENKDEEVTNEESQEENENEDINESDEEIEGETTHFTVADQWGNMVSYTTTIEQVFGSGIMVPEYGVMLNNELTDFDASPGGANQVDGNKRPLSSMSPTIVLKDDEPFMTVGSPGGTTIITSVAQVILNVIGYDQELKDAIEEPRLFSSEYPSIRWEYGVPSDVREKLVEMGHEWEEENVEIGNVNSLVIQDGKYYGAADSTREGVATGLSNEDFEQEVDKSTLEDKIKEVEKLEKDDYTEDSWDDLQDALERAKNILSSEDSTQTEVDEALEILEKAMTELEQKDEEEKEEPKEVDKSALEDLLKKINDEKLKEEEYTKDSWKEFQEALQYAEDMLEKDDATEKEINKTISILKKARESLKLVEKPEVDEGNSNNEDVGASTTIEKTTKGDKLPSTATTIFNILLIGAILIILGVIIFVIRKRRTS